MMRCWFFLFLHSLLFSDPSRDFIRKRVDLSFDGKHSWWSHETLGSESWAGRDKGGLMVDFFWLRQEVMDQLSLPALFQNSLRPISAQSQTESLILRLVILHYLFRTCECPSSCREPWLLRPKLLGKLVPRLWLPRENRKPLFTLRRRRWFSRSQPQLYSSDIYRYRNCLPSFFRMGWILVSFDCPYI